MPVDRHQICFPVFVAHHCSDGFFVNFSGIDQYQILAGLDLVVESAELPVLAVDTGQAAYPGTKQCDHNSDKQINNSRYIRAEWLEEHEQCRSNYASDKPKVCSNDPVSDEILRLQIVTGMYVFFF